MRRVLLGTLCVCVLGLATGCGVTTSDPTAGTQPTGTMAPTATTGTTAPTATTVPGPPTPTNVPAGWQVYSGQHFTIAYPNGWTYTISPPQTGLMGDGFILSDPAASPATGQVEAGEAWGYSQSQLQTICQLSGTKVTLAGLTMNYTVGEGVHRNWLFINSDGVEFVLDARDANQPSSVQQRYSSILATFRLDDSTPGCAWT